MREILNDIFTWSWYSEPHGYNFNGHLIRHAEGNLCIDPVEPGEEGLDEIARLGATRILLTNRNHSRASNKVRERPFTRTKRPTHATRARRWMMRLRWRRPSARSWWWGPLESRPARWRSIGRRGTF